jgi:site-specific recombinase XerD
MNGSGGTTINPKAHSQNDCELLHFISFTVSYPQNTIRPNKRTFEHLQTKTDQIQPMITPKFYLRTGANKTAGKVYVKFYIKGEKLHFSTEVEADISEWDVENSKIKGKSQGAKDRNIVINNIRSRINNVDVKFRLREKELSKALFLRHYNRPDDYTTFHDWCDEYKRQTFKFLNYNTQRMHDSVLKKLKEFAPELHFDDITKLWLEGYIFHLKRDLGNSHNTSYKNMAVLKKYIYAALNAGYLEENPFAGLKIPQERTDVVYLEEDELKKFYMLYRNFNMEQKYFKTLQIFLFMCFGSQHIGDAKAMKLEQFSSDNFSYYRLKTKDRKPELVTVPLSAPLRNILADIAGERKKGLIFEELPADQTMNEYLKTIAGHIGVKKEISHKTGRHTFATIFLENNPNIRTLQSILGHSDIKTTMKYVHALKKAKQRGISCFDKFMK